MAKLALYSFWTHISFSETSITVLSKARVFVVLAIPLIVEVYAYYQLIVREGLINVLIVVSLVTSVIFGLNVLLVLLGAYTSEFNLTRGSPGYQKPSSPNAEL